LVLVDLVGNAFAIQEQVMFMRRRFPFLPVLMAALILMCMMPLSVSADEGGPTPEAAPVITTTPEGTFPEDDQTTADQDEVVPVVESVEAPEQQVETDAGIQSSEGMSPDTLLRKMPIWCPPGVEPVPGENGCTAEFGSISLLMDYLNTNGLADAGTIWLPDAAPTEDQTAAPDQDSTGPTSTDTPITDGEKEAGVNIVLLDNSGNSIPLESEEGVNALLNGQPVWCPEGITPENEGDGCTTSVGSLGLLVSMMENGSLDNGAIYIQTSVEEGSAETTTSQDGARNTETLEGQATALQTGQTEELARVEQEPDASPESAPEPSLRAVLKDPIWCPDFVAPTPGSNGCTAMQPDLETLITVLTGLDPAQAGTIWIEDGVDASSASIVIDGTAFSNMQTFSLALRGGWSGISGDLSITGNTTFNNKAVSIVNWQHNIAVSNIVVNGFAGGTGLVVETTGVVSLNTITSNNNMAGIDVTSGGYIDTTDITTTGNSTYGTWLDNCARVIGGPPTSWSCTNAVDEAINVMGSNDFSNNGTDSTDASHSGLIVTSNGDVFIENTVSSQNANYGTHVTTSGDVLIEDTDLEQNRVGLRVENNGIGIPVTFRNVTANTNAGTGIAVFSLGEINAEDITASDNLGAGIRLANSAGSGAVSIFGTSIFNSNGANGSAGIIVDSVGDVTVQNVVVSNTDAANGMSVTTSAGIIVACSAFNNNFQYGFDASNFSTLDINGTTFSGNGSGDYVTVGSGAITLDPSCNPGSGGAGGATGSTGGTGSSSSPVNVIALSNENGTDSVELNCVDFGSTQLTLSNGDRVTYVCPTTGDVNLLRVAADGENFPAALPGGFTFISALDTHRMENGVEQTLTAGELVISFVIPVDLAGFDVTFLYWDGTNWVDLSTATLADGKTVFNGGVKTQDGRFEATTNFTGMFVLARK
jgi:hypothetical protein